MKNRFKVSFVSTLALVIASLVCTGSVLAKKKVRVDPIPHAGGQCYQFIAEDQPGPPKCTNAKSSIWLVETVGGANCNVKVWAADDDGTLTCVNVKKGSNLISSKNLPDLNVKEPGSNGKKLSSAITADTKCDHVWLRFTDNNDCNSRCYINNGRAYCR